MINVRIKQCQAHLQTILLRYLPAVTSSSFISAMHYACLNGGKRLRPLLAYCTGEIFDIPPQNIDPLAVAIEFIHCYSLIHDDLPSMDNDDLRRGKPTCHKIFGEANAILAGDALLTLAFEVLSCAEHFPHLGSSTLLKIIRQVAAAGGARNGMVIGQAIDINGHTLTLKELCQMHQAKTGSLINATIQCTALMAKEINEISLENLQNYGTNIGLAFQIQDDILDTLGTADNMGKYPHQDKKNNKCTFVSLLGLEEAKIQLQHYYKMALCSLESFGAKAIPLRELSTYIVERVA